MAEYGQLHYLPGMLSDYDFSSAQYTLAKVTSGVSNHVGLLASKTDTRGAGLVTNVPKSGQHAAVAWLGLAKINVHSAVYAGQQFTASASGGAIPAGSGDVIYGTVLANASPGELTSCMLFAVGARAIA